MMWRLINLLSPLQKALLVASCAALLFVGGNMWSRNQAIAQLPPVFEDIPVEVNSTTVAQNQPPSRRIVVHVAGEVRKPGVLELPPGARVGDAVKRAGGASEAGDLHSLNLAQKLRDGQQIVVARRGEANGTASHPMGSAPAAQQPATVAGVRAAPRGKAPSRPVNVNTASAAELETLPGIGPALAARIIAHRAQGRLASMEDLDAVKGLGPKKLEKLRPYVIF